MNPHPRDGTGTHGGVYNPEPPERTEWDQGQDPLSNSCVRNRVSVTPQHSSKTRDRTRFRNNPSKTMLDLLPSSDSRTRLHSLPSKDDDACTPDSSTPDTGKSESLLHDRYLAYDIEWTEGAGHSIHNKMTTPLSESTRLLGLTDSGARQTGCGTGHQSRDDTGLGKWSRGEGPSEKTDALQRQGLGTVQPPVTDGT